MSHIVTIETQVRDPVALTSACRRLGLAPPQLQTTRLFSGAAIGHCVQLPGWRYPVVCQVDSGQVLFDNFENRWGERRHLDALLQAYAIETCRREALRQGHTVIEQSLADGRVRLSIQLGEAGALSPAEGASA